MKTMAGGVYDPETIELLRAVLDGAWNSLAAEAQAHSSKCLLAERILRLAATGERNPIRLRAAGLIGLINSRSHHGISVLKPTDSASVR
jgi:hypothetical protein